MSTGILVIVAVLCAAVGFILGALVAILIPRGEKKYQEDEPEKGSQNTRNREIARLWRDPSTGQLFTELDQRLLSSANSLNPETRRQLQQVSIEWGKWLGLPSGQPVQTPSGSIASPQSAPQAAPRIPSAEVKPIPATPFQALLKPVEIERPAQLSIVGQIDEVLQEMLADSPLAGRSIRLTDEPREGVIAWVGLNRYIGIDAIPDIEAKTMVRAAVKEWERRSEATGRPA